jgi:hypothetical protein
MSRTVYRISIMLHALCMLTAESAFADDASAMRDGQDRWVPSVGLTLGFTSQKQDGDVKSEIFVFGNFFPVRPEDSSSKYMNLLNVGGTFELQTPRLLPYKWSPSLFFGGEVLNVSSQRRSIAKEGDPRTELIDPDGGAGGTFPDTAILGQGSEVTSDADNVQYGASVGLSFPVDVGDWQISIKPSARYVRQKFDYTGIVSNGNRFGQLPAPPPTDVLLLQSDTSKDVHAVGPALEIEVGAARIKSVAASVFVSGGGYRVLSDRSVSMIARGFSSLGNGPYRGTFSAEIDKWIYGANVGIRIKWLGASSGWLGGVLRDPDE